MMNSKIARHKPIARPTAYDFNVQYDALNNQGDDYDCPFSEKNVIREGELLVAYKDSVEKWLDKGLHVTSYVEESKKINKNNDPNLSYVGVAVTDFDPRDGRGNLQQGLVASAGGLMTLVNNGPGKIVAGMPVYVIPPSDFTSHKNGRSGWVYGTPKNKTTCYVSNTDTNNIAKIGKALSSAPRNGTFDICLSQMG